MKQMEHDVTDGLKVAFGSIGAACLVAAAVGGGVKIAGSEVPIVASPVRVGLLAALGLALIVVAMWKSRPRMVTFLVTRPRSAIAVPKGTIEKPYYETKSFGGQVSEVRAAGYRKSEDGKSYVFFDRDGQVVKEIRAVQVGQIERAPKS